MQTVLTKYWLAIHVAVLLLAAWAGLSQSALSEGRSLLWLSLLAAEALVLLPSVKKGETLADARLRVVRSIVHDPFFYLGGSLLLFVFVQWLNSGCSLVYLSDADVWQYSPPPVSWAPFCVNAKEALSTVSAFLACFAVGLVLRNSVGKEGKRALVQGASALSGVVGAWMVWKACQGAEPFSGLAANAGCFSVGPFFSFWLVLGLGVFIDALARGQRGTAVLFTLGFICNFVAMLFFASTFALLLYSAVTLVLAVYAMLYLRHAVSKVVQLKAFLVLAAALASVVVAVLFVFPGSPVAVKMGGWAELVKHWDLLSGLREARVDAALKIWREHLWAGVGANGFLHYVGTVVDAKDWGLIQKDQALVLHDSVQFLCEFGVLGLSLLGASAFALVVPVCYRARLAWQKGPLGGGEPQVFLLRVSPIVVTGVCATALCFVESWVAGPFRLAGLLTSWVFVMALLPSFLPAKK